MFRKYPKIQRLGKEETDGILEGMCYIQEKIDGANASVWMGVDGKICCGSRNQQLTKDVSCWEETGNNGFNGFLDYIKNHEGISKYLMLHPEHTLYGEWCVKHSIAYKETSYKKFYMFDILRPGLTEFEWMNSSDLALVSSQYKIEAPQVFGVFADPTPEQLDEFVGKSCLGEEGEGVVIKNFDFINKFGENQFAKIVTQRFREKNALTFGGNSKHSECYLEQYFVNKFMTLARVQKTMQKAEAIKGRLDMEHTPMIIQMSYHDLLTEEVWEIAKKNGVIDFRKFKGLCAQKSKQIFHDILHDDISVADKE